MSLSNEKLNILMQNLQTSLELMVKYFKRVEAGDAGSKRDGILEYEKILLGTAEHVLEEAGKINPAIRRSFEETFVRGELSSLQWISTCKSLTTMDKVLINRRIGMLEDFLDGKIEPDSDGTKEKKVPNFYGGNS